MRMTTTNNTIAVSFYESDSEAVSEGTRSVEAAYFQFEEGWVVFKDAEHKAIAAYPKSAVAGIEVKK